MRIEPLEDRRLLSITVNTLVDENDGAGVGGVSLRDAIAAAAPGDAIEFDPALTAGGPATILLTHGELAIANSLTINGPGANLLTIRAFDQTPGTKNADGSRVFNIDDSTSTARAASITGLTLTGADVGLQGGAVISKENLTVAACTITANYATVSGAAIHNDGGTLIVNNCTISGNSSFSYSGGGGISSRGDTTVSHSTISGNTAADSGGGIWHSGGTLTLTDCTITGNSTRLSTPFNSEGGGVWSDTNTIITRCTISGNRAGFYDFYNGNGGGMGGGVFSSGALTITESSISGNAAIQGAVFNPAPYGYGGVGGGVYHTGGAASIVSSNISNNNAWALGGGVVNYIGTLTITDSTISGNSGALNGGGVYSTSGNASRSTTSLTINRSTISGNTGGGIISRGANLTINTSTISGNSAGRGGGVDSDNITARVSYSTIAGNSASSDGGGMWSVGNLTMRHTIVAGNTRGAASEQNDVTGAVTAAFTLFGVDTGATIANSGGIATNLIGTAAAPIDPLLGPLADNGGPTLPNGGKMLTRFPLPGSPAIDAGDPLIVGQPEYDQRGVAFERIVGGRIDMGAVEFGAISANFDGDRHIGGADFLAWQRGFGLTTGATLAQGDAEKDSDVDAADLDVWKSEFGLTQPAAAAATESAALVAAPYQPASSSGRAQSETVLSPAAVDAALAWQQFQSEPSNRLFRRKRR